MSTSANLNTSPHFSKHVAYTWAFRAYSSGVSLVREVPSDSAYSDVH